MALFYVEKCLTAVFLTYQGLLNRYYFLQQTVHKFEHWKQIKKKKKNNSNFFRIIIVKRLMYLQKNTTSSKTWSTVSSTNTPKFSAFFCSMTGSFHSIVTLYSTITKKWKMWNSDWFFNLNNWHNVTEDIQADTWILIVDKTSQKISDNFERTFWFPRFLPNNKRKNSEK